MSQNTGTGTNTSSVELIFGEDHLESSHQNANKNSQDGKKKKLILVGSIVVIVVAVMAVVTTIVVLVGDSSTPEDEEDVQKPITSCGEIKFYILSRLK